MIKLNKLLSWVGLDGLLHLVASAVIVLITQIFAPWWVAVLVAVLVGIGKELIWDYWLCKGYMQRKDLVCDAVGILIGCLGFL